MNMVITLGPLIVLLLFAMAYALVDKWEQLKFQLIIRMFVVIVVLGAMAYGLRYWIVFGVTCLPNCVGANLVGSDLRGMRLNNADLVNANLSR
ncbi:MAG: pentapeptide repeat-containing protein, partial [Caldilineaceae bacterium]|nr:pentapeptide repeat-containing protein [Caldilineaceae bacterium]